MVATASTSHRFGSCSRDPIRYRGGSFGLYVFVGNRSLSKVDPSGLFDLPGVGGDEFDVPWPLDWIVPPLGSDIFDNGDEVTQEILEHYMNGEGAPYTIDGEGMGIISDLISGSLGSEMATRMQDASGSCSEGSLFSVPGDFNMPFNFTGQGGLFTLGDTNLEIAYECTMQCTDKCMWCYYCDIRITVNDRFEDALDVKDWLDWPNIEMPGGTPFDMNGTTYTQVDSCNGQ